MGFPDFNPELDKITEREVVYDFVSRVMIGKRFTSYEDETKIIFMPPRTLKEIMRKTVNALPRTIENNLDNIKTITVQVPVGATSVSFTLPSGCDRVLLVYSERTRTDLTSLFVKGSGGVYRMTLDVAYASCPDPDTTSYYVGSNADILKAYCLTTKDAKDPKGVKNATIQ